jgi:lipoyl(octanoyl) transferase
MSAVLKIKKIGLIDYPQCFTQMQAFTEGRDASSVDELWLVEHPPVYTQGLAGKAEHIINAGDIPVVQANRGGQVTYHGPGQVVIYFLLDITRLKLGVRDLVTRIENTMIALLADYGLNSNSDKDAPGVYVQGAKIGSIGLRVTKGRTYHGLSLNVDMDLSPYQGINPCGYAGMQVAQLADLLPEEAVALNMNEVQQVLASKLAVELEYDTVIDL